jgi:hypothetical protein
LTKYSRVPSLKMTVLLMQPPPTALWVRGAKGRPVTAPMWRPTDPQSVTGGYLGPMRRCSGLLRGK